MICVTILIYNFRLDEKEGDAYRWILISWSPDSASVRNKMLYASTKASLKKDFGGAHIYDDLYGNVKEDISLHGYERHVKHEESSREDMMTQEEKEREEVRKVCWKTLDSNMVRNMVRKFHYEIKFLQNNKSNLSISSVSQMLRYRWIANKITCQV